MRRAFLCLGYPRQRRNLRCPLIVVVTFTVYGVLSGKQSFMRMTAFLKRREDRLAELFGLSNGVPNHGVFSDMFRLLELEAFTACFEDWVSEAFRLPSGKYLAIDGKAVRAAARKLKGGMPTYVISAFLCGVGFTIAQVEIGEKRSEIIEIRRLLEMLDLEECAATIDAIATQVKIVDIIVGRGGDFGLQLKANNPTALGTRPTASVISW